MHLSPPPSPPPAHPPAQGRAPPPLRRCAAVRASKAIGGRGSHGDRDQVRSGCDARTVRGGVPREPVPALEGCRKGQAAGAASRRIAALEGWGAAAGGRAARAARIRRAGAARGPKSASASKGSREGRQGRPGRRQQKAGIRRLVPRQPLYGEEVARKRPPKLGAGGGS